MLILNWKMNPKSLTEANKLIFAYEKQIQDLKIKPRSILIAPPSLFLPVLVQKHPDFIFGGQNCSDQDQGALTGEISASMLKSAGAGFVILGHSERKKMGESLALINRKIIAALKNKIKVVLCFGEIVKPKNFQTAPSEWRRQAKILFNQLDQFKNLGRDLIVAFEPAWAISVNRQGSVSIEYLNLFIRWFRAETEKKIKHLPLIYGGSVDAEVVKLFQSAEIKGFLIGSKSLEPSEFGKISRAYYN